MKISIKMKDCKTFCKAQTASHLKETIQPPRIPPPPKEIYRNMMVKHFARCKQQAALKKLFSLSPSHPRPTTTKGDTWNYTDICFQSASRIQFLGVTKQSKYFSGTKQKHVCREICKVRKIFGCVVVAYYFHCQVS